MGFVKKVASTEGSFISRRQALSLMRLHASAILFGGSLHSMSTAHALDLPAQSLAVTTVNHLSYASQNYKLTRDFYVDFLGMRDVWDDGSKCQLDFGSIESPNSFYMTGAKPRAEPTIAHYGFGLPNYWNVVNQLKEDLLKRPLQGVHPDGEAGWFLNGPSGFVQRIVAAKDPAMFPGAAAFCDIARSKECKDAFALGVQNLNATPKPSPQSFKPLYFDYIVLRVKDVRKEAEFYVDVMRMKSVSLKKDEVKLRFGENTMVIKSAGANEKPFCNEFGFIIENYSEETVKKELMHRGIESRTRPDGGVLFKDPNGLQIGISGKV